MKRTVPNGWIFRLPNEVYLTSEGRVYDVTGVPPDVTVKFFPTEVGRDVALELALRLLRSQ